MVENPKLNDILAWITMIGILSWLDFIFIKKYKSYKGGNVKQTYSNKNMCSVCHNEKTKVHLSEGLVCSTCMGLAGLELKDYKKIQTYSVVDINRMIEYNMKNKLEIENFKTTKKIGGFIEFDDINKKWFIPKDKSSKAYPKIYNYEDILEFELLKDGESVTKGGIGKAVAGGLIFGGVGAIVGGSTGKKTTKEVIKSLNIKITLNDINDPTEYINLIDFKTPKFEYQNIYTSTEEILSTLSIILEGNKTVLNKKNYSDADEIVKFKNLFEEGVITQEEFNKKKQEILGL